MKDKQYIGDSVYAKYDGHHVLLTTENGMGASNFIYLDSSVLENLLRYMENVFGVTIKVEKRDEHPSGDAA